MSVVIRRRFKANGLLADPDAAVLADALGVYGIRERDTGTVVVAAGTALTRDSVGMYRYVFAGAQPGRAYEFVVAFTLNGQTIYEQDSVIAPVTGNLYSLEPRISTYVGGVPQPVLRQSLRQVACEFFRMTEMWKEDLAPIDSVAGQKTYAIELTADATVLRVESVMYDGLPRTFVVDSTLDAIQLGSAPTRADDPIVVSVVLFPNESNATYPQPLLDRWGRAIIDGTIALLAAIPKRPWTNMDLAAQRAASYAVLIAEAKGFGFTQRGNANQRVRPRRFV